FDTQFSFFSYCNHNTNISIIYLRLKCRLSWKNKYHLINPFLNSCQAGDSSRRLATVCVTICIVLLISSNVLNRPRLNRKVPWASSLSKPIANNTCEGSREPVEHADPEAIERLLARAIICSAFRKRKVMLLT